MKRAWPIFIIAATLPAQVISNDPTHMADAPFWELRQSAFDAVLRDHKLSELAVQEGIVRLLNLETNNPKWGELDEELPYENYYGELLDTTQKIATQYHNQDAWHAMVYSNYNEGSEWGKWLAAQPDVFPMIWNMAHARSGDRDNSGLQLLAYALVRCYAPNAPNCEVPLAKKDEILTMLRSGLTSPHESTRVGSIVGLGICGLAEDVDLLLKTASVVEKTPATGGENAEEGKYAVVWLLKDSAKKIQARLSQKPTAS